MNDRKKEVSNSISSLYKELLNKRKEERELKKNNIQESVEEEELIEDDKLIKLSKKERREKEMNNWKDVLASMIGEDLAYEEKKPKKKKYKKWIDDEDDNKIIDVKPKKVKKKNYQKEFEPELNLLRNLIADQNKFNIDLQKRFNIAMGPANKDGAPPNKTMVELASAIVAGRNNSLGILKEIGSLKKNIADLYMKQKKLNYDLKGETSVTDNSDLMLLGSNIMSSFDNKFLNAPTQEPQQVQNIQPQHQPVILQNNTHGYEEVKNITPRVPNTFNSNIQEFDPSTWNGGPSIDKQVLFENIPKTVVVEKNSQTGDMRFKAIRNDTGEELVNYPGLPTSDPYKLKINEKDMMVKGTFDETYKLVTV